MIIQMSAPSKTFLSGEYAVLCGGEALVLNTGPRFTFIAKKGTGRVAGIPVGSPAAGWLEQRSPVWQGWDLEFSDPHAGKGGFGASGAQFLLVHAFTTFLQTSVSRAVQGYDLLALWNDFQVLSGGNSSGADVLAQFVGRVALVDMQNASANAGPWPFAKHGFAIVRTNQKVSTHEHVRHLDRTQLMVLLPKAKVCAESFAAGAITPFLDNLNSYVQQLADLNLQAPSTLERTQALRREKWCLAAKGCGALGADTILVIFAYDDRAAAMASLADLHIVATEQDLSEDLSQNLSAGLMMNWSWT